MNVFLYEEQLLFHIGNVILIIRYSGRTQKQLAEFVRENFVKRPDFHR